MGQNLDDGSSLVLLLGSGSDMGPRAGMDDPGTARVIVPQAGSQSQGTPLFSAPIQQ